MAFVGAISDLFSCGRARRPQTHDETRDGANTNTADATRADPVVPDIQIDATPPTDSSDKTPSSPSDATPRPVLGDDLPQISPLENRPSIEGRASTVRPSTDAVRSLQYVPEEAPQSRTRRIESSGEKTKASSGWQVEKQFLVTTNTPEASNATPKLSLDKAESSIVDVTPIVSAPIVAPTPVETTESKAEVVDEVVAQPVVTDAKVDAEYPFLPEPVLLSQSEDMAVSESVSIVQVQEPEAIKTDSVPAEEDSAEIELPQTAPAQFLDLPTEIRNLIYEKMTEEGPIRMCRHDDPALARAEGEQAHTPKRQFFNLTQVCRQLRTEFLPVYEQRAEYIIDLWTQRSHLAEISSLKGHVAMDIDAACFDMQPIDLLPLIRYIARTRRTNCRFASTEGVVFRSIEAIVEQLNKLIPSSSSKAGWLAAINGPMKRIDLHLFPHEDIRQYYRFRGAEPMLRIVYPAAATESWMKQSHKSGGEYESYLEKTGLDALDMYVVVGHASSRTTNEGRLPLNWRLSYAGSRLSVEQAVRISGQYTR